MRVDPEKNLGVVSLKESACHGVGLIANKNLSQGEPIHITHAWSDRYDEWVNIIPNCLYNHSQVKENCEIKTHKPLKTLYVLKNIKKGEELFLDYTKDTDLEQPEKNWKI